MAGVQDILRPVTITKIVSRLAASYNTLLTFMGMQPGGPLERVVGGRDASYDIFNNVRTVGKLTAPGTPASRRARNPVGRVPFTFPRMHESMFLLAEEISNLRRIGGPSAERDLQAQDYIKRQMIMPAQRAANFRAAMVSGMMQNSLYAGADGQDWYLTFTSSGNLFQINSQLPSGNQNQLNMVYQISPESGSIYGANIIDVSWANSSANIPLHLSKMNAAMRKQSGVQLAHMWCDSITWNYVISNDYVASQAGIAESPFSTYQRVIGEGPDGTPLNEFLGVIKAVPWLTWHISDEVIDIGAVGSETPTQLIPANQCFGMPQPNALWTEMLLGSEPIAEYDNGPWQQKIGLSTWTKTTSNPTGWEVFTLDNALSVLEVPAAIVNPTVIF
jgi:hypothetical protein